MGSSSQNLRDSYIKLVNTTKSVLFKKKMPNDGKDDGDDDDDDKRRK